MMDATVKDYKMKMINKIYDKVGRPLAVCVWVMTLLAVGLRFLTSTPIPDAEEAAFGFATIGLVLGIGFAGLTFIFFLIVLIIYLLADGKRGYEIVVTASQLAPKQELQDIDAWLRSLGFRAFASYETVYPKKRNLVWSYLDETESIYAELVEEADGKHYLAFVSDYLDKFRLQTFFNKAQDFSSKLIVSRNFEENLDAAFHYHARQQEFFRKEHGEAKTYQSLNDVFLSVDERKVLQRSIYARYMKWLGKWSLASLLIGLMAYFGIIFFMPLIGAETILFVVAMLVGLYCWFLRDMTAIVGESQKKKPNSA
jgi:hypothetical protein